MPSVILRDTKLQGNISENSSITLDGMLLGDIKAEEVIIKENGNVTAKVRGKLFHRNLVVDEGAQLEIAASTRKKITNNNKD